MSHPSTIKNTQKQNGSAFEFGLISGLASELRDLNYEFIIQQNHAYLNLSANFKTLARPSQNEFLNAGITAAKEILKIEKKFLESPVILQAQCDREGIKGDVRDILLITPHKTIGISCKNNNEAAKHSRISPNLDFVRDWLKADSGASLEYRTSIHNIFATLKPLLKKSWSDIDPDNLIKPNHYYEPILLAFKTELENQINKDPSSAEKIFKYLIGEQDYYKVVKKDLTKVVEIQGYNLTGSLAKSIKTVALPSVVVNSYFKPNRSGIKNKLIINFSNNWSLGLRIHNAREFVENSFKFDIGIEQSPVIFKKILSFNI